MPIPVDGEVSVQLNYFWNLFEIFLKSLWNILEIFLKYYRKILEKNWIHDKKKYKMGHFFCLDLRSFIDACPSGKRVVNFFERMEERSASNTSRRKVGVQFNFFSKNPAPYRETVRLNSTLFLYKCRYQSMESLASNSTIFEIILKSFWTLFDIFLKYSWNLFEIFSKKSWKKKNEFLVRKNIKWDAFSAWI